MFFRILGFGILLVIAVFFQLFPKLYEPAHPIQRNNFCREVQDYQENKDINLKKDWFLEADFLNHMVCNWRKKPKLVWVDNDGQAISQTDILFQGQEEYGGKLTVQSPEFRLSGPIHETLLTGIFSRNLAAAEIKEDNLIDQLEFKFIGRAFPVLFLARKYFKSIDEYPSSDYYLQPVCGEKNDFINFAKQKNTYKNYTTDTDYDADDMRSYEQNLPLPFDEQDVADCMLEKVFASDDHVFLYETYPDHMNHLYGKYSVRATHQEFLIQTVEKHIGKYIAENRREAVYVCLSDHGGQAYRGDDAHINHGFLDAENQAYAYFLSDDLATNGFRDSMDTMDVVSTVSTLVQNLNIPLLNEGTPFNSFKNDPLFSFLVQYQHYMQLKQLAMRIGNMNGVFKKHIDRAEMKKIEDKIELKNQEIKKLLNGSQYKETFYDDEGISIINNSNLKLLEKFDMQDLTDTLKDHNKVLQKGIIDYRVNNKKTWLFIVLTITALAFTGLFFNSTKKSFKYLYKTFLENNAVSDKVLLVLMVVLFCSNIFMCVFIASLKRNLLLAQCIAFVVVKWLIILVLMFKKIKKFIDDKTEINKGDFIQSQEDEYDEEDSNFKQQKVYKSKINQIQDLLMRQIKGFQIYQLAKQPYNQMLGIMLFSGVADILCFRFNSNNMFLWEKRHMSKLENQQQTFLRTSAIYLLFVGYIFFDAKKQFFAKHMEKGIILVMILMTMAQYDFMDQDEMKTFLQFQLNVFNTFSLFLFYSYCLASHKLLKQERGSDFLKIQKILILVYLFYMGDLIDKICIVTIFIPVSHMFATVLKNKLIPKQQRIIASQIIVGYASVFFLVCKGQYEQDVNQIAGLKGLGRTKEDYPFFTALLFGTNKFQSVIIPFLFIIENINFKQVAGTFSIKISQLKTSILNILILKGYVTVCALYLIIYITSAESYFLLWMLYFLVSIVIGIAYFFIPWMAFSVKAKLGKIMKININRYVYLVMFVVLNYLLIRGFMVSQDEYQHVFKKLHYTTKISSAPP